MSALQKSAALHALRGEDSNAGRRHERERGQPGGRARGSLRERGEAGFYTLGATARGRRRRRLVQRSATGLGDDSGELKEDDGDGL